MEITLLVPGQCVYSKEIMIGFTCALTLWYVTS